MLKKTLIATAVLAASTGLAFANGGTYVPPVHHVGNFYVGAAASRDFANFDTNQRWSQFKTSDPSDIFLSSNTNHDFGDNGWNGEIFGGYGMTFQDHYYLGAEIFGSLSNVDAKYNTQFTIEPDSNPTLFRDSKKIDLDYSYGISLMPGVKLSDSTLLYGRVGWIRSRFELSGSLLIPSADPGPGFTNRVSYGTKDTEDGLQLGLGVDTKILNHVSVRAEYDWNYYDNLKASARSNKFFAPNYTLAYTATVNHPIVNQFKLGLAYHFMG